MANPDLYMQFWGLQHLIGTTVTAQIGGLDAGNYTVAADGSITVPYQSDTGGLLTPSYLETVSAATGGSGAEQLTTFNVYDGTSTVSVTVPVVIGPTYTTQGQMLRPALADDIKSPTGPALGKPRRSHMYALLVNNGIQISIGTDFGSTLQPTRFTSDGGYSPELALSATVYFNGVHVGVLTDTWSYDSMPTWQVNRPWPCTILAVSAFLEGSER